MGSNLGGMVYQTKLSSVQFELVRVSDEPEFGTTENCCTFTTKVKKEKADNVFRQEYIGHEVSRELSNLSHCGYALRHSQQIGRAHV